MFMVFFKCMQLLAHSLRFGDIFLHRLAFLLLGWVKFIIIIYGRAVGQSDVAYSLNVSPLFRGCK